MFFESFKTFFKNIKIAIPSLILSILYYLFLVLINNIDYSNIEYMASDELINYFLDIMGIFFLAIIIFSLLGVFIQCWTIYMSSSAIKNEPFTLLSSLTKSSRYFLKSLGVFAIQFAIWFGFFIGILFIFSMFIISISTSNNSPLAFSIVLSIIFLILGIFFAITLYPIIYVLISDNLEVGESFSKGFKFGLKNFINILGVFAFIFIIMFFIFILISIPFLVQNTEPNDFINVIWYTLCSFMSIIIGIYILKLYNSQKYKDNFNKEKEIENNNLIIDSETTDEETNNKTLNHIEKDSDLHDN